MKFMTIIDNMFPRKKYISKINFGHQYIQEKLGNDKYSIQRHIIGEIIPHDQDTVGDDLDCTLSSISTLFEYLVKLDFEDIYNHVIDIGVNPKWISNPRKYGTIPLFIKNIINNVLKAYKDKGLIANGGKSRQLYLKGLGYNINTIINQIDNSNPVILNLSGNSHKDYYSNHTILIIGYHIFENKKREKIVLLKIYDNWETKHNTYLDYNAIPFISSINYIK
ncbi:MAG: hypothetical protein N4A50_06220 [Vallitalea sp.]|nr:hypothetical protein [Vallitalea sp.]